eukprot:14552651-Heterocapsa_arctica.AAC.1
MRHMVPGAWNPALVVIRPAFQLTMVDLLVTFPPRPEDLTRASALSPSPGDGNSSWMPDICMRSIVMVTSHCHEMGLPLMSDSVMWSSSHCPMIGICALAVAPQSLRIEFATWLLGSVELASLPSMGGSAASAFLTHSRA